MTDDPDQTQPESTVAPTRPSPGVRARRARRATVKRTLIVFGVVVLILTLFVASLWMARREAARQILTGWLEDRGVAADIQVETIALDRFVGRLTIGDPADPDVRVERVEVDYVVAAPWSPTGLGVTPSRIRLIRPLVRARWTEGRLSLGVLDPLIEEFAGRPPDPARRGPLVLIEGGEARVVTDHGVVRALAEGRVDDGRLMQLDARVPAMRLSGGGLEATLGEIRIAARTTGETRDRQVVAVSIEGTAERLARGDTSGEALAGRVTAALPYPDRAILDQAQPVSAQLVLSAGRLESPAGSVRDLAAEVSLDGTLWGWLDAFQLDVWPSGPVRAAAVATDPVQAQGLVWRADGARLAVERDGSGVAWRLTGPQRLGAERLAANGATFARLDLTSDALSVGGRGAAWEASGPAALAARRFDFNGLTLTGVRGRAGFDLVSDQGVTLSMTSELASAGGSWPLFGAVGSDDVPELAAMKQALGDFDLAAPALRLVADAGGAQVSMTRPVTVRPRNGGVLTLTAASGPVYRQQPGQLGGGALALAATRGEGLPQARFDVTRWRLTPGGFSAELDGRAALDFGLARGLDVATAGTLALDRGVTTYRPARCLDVTAARLELGENDAIDVRGDLCPGAAALVTVREGGWRVEGRFAGITADVQSFQAGVREAAGTMTVLGGPQRLDLTTQVSRAGVVDLAETVRFLPLLVSGEARLSNEQWRGGFDLARGATGLGHAAFHHDGQVESGGVVIDLPNLTFAEGGLQPRDLTPLLNGMVDGPVTGRVAFNGRFDWSPAGVTSGGVAMTDGLDFVSPAGLVEGLAGQVDLVSLTPAISAPDQRLTVRRVGAFTPLTELELAFDLDAESLNVGAFELDVAGGVIRVEPTAFPLDGAREWSGVILLERVQLGEVIAASRFADKISMDAVVSGRLPFTSSPTEGVRIFEGSLHAVEPGRLSISREALSEVQAGGAGDEVSENTVQDLAYQAMENLAFDTLTAEVNSLAGGRMSLLFSIKGRHDPPRRQELRLTLMELISRDFLNRELPLPSGTEIDLTLDTTLNANQLASDFMALQRARRGE